MTSVDLALDPPSFGVRLDGGTGATRETERSRLRPMTSDKNLTAAEAAVKVEGGVKAGMVSAADIVAKEAKVRSDGRC